MAFWTCWTILCLTYGYIAAVVHANFLDKLEEKRRTAALSKVTEDHSHIQPTILNYDTV